MRIFSGTYDLSCLGFWWHWGKWWGMGMSRGGRGRPKFSLDEGNSGEPIRDIDRPFIIRNTIGVSERFVPDRGHPVSWRRAGRHRPGVARTREAGPFCFFLCCGRPRRRDGRGHVARLEARASTRLFDRSRAGTFPTPAGERAQAGISAGLDAIREGILRARAVVGEGRWRSPARRTSGSCRSCRFWMRQALAAGREKRRRPGKRRPPVVNGPAGSAARGARGPGALTLPGAFRPAGLSRDEGSAAAPDDGAGALRGAAEDSSAHVGDRCAIAGHAGNDRETAGLGGGRIPGRREQSRWRRPAPQRFVR